jgi:hypothetical protein
MSQPQVYDQELKLFSDLFIAIWNHHRKPWLRLRGQAKDIFQDIAPKFNTITTVEELEASLPSETRVSAEFPPNRFLYLNPIVSGGTLLPVLRLKCDFGRSIPEVRIRMGLFLREGVDTKAIGYRLEAPEGPGAHHYYHVQMIRGFQRQRNFTADQCLTWFPDQAPTFPLDVDSPVRLALSLLIGLYGLVDTGTMLRDMGLIVRVKPYLDKMICFTMPPIEWYWTVLKSSATKHEFYRTLKDPTQFRSDFRGHAGVRIKAITQGCFEAQPKKNQRVHN